MDLIPSFTIDHTKLMPGIYVSRVDAIGDEFTTTFDLRMTMPNREPALQGNAMHTIEHLVATYLRNDSVWKDEIIYFGPMGCLTGCYLVMKGKRTPEEILHLVINAFKFAEEFEGEVPGAKPDECGNYLFHDLQMAKWYAHRYVNALEHCPYFEYPEKKKASVAFDVYTAF